MADAPAPAAHGKDALAFLTRKIGPAPVWVYAVVIVGAYYWYTRYGPGKSSGSGTSVPVGQQTDPAGNVGVIDPLTGYVQGSAEDTASLQAQNEIAAGTGQDNSGTTTSSSTGGYATNDQWATAAENYLIGLGIDPTVATQAIGNYLGSLANTTALQADVNTAIEGLGPPPQLPGPADTNPPPATGGGGTGTGGGGGGGGTPAAKVKVPNVVGKTVNQAHSALTSAGLSFNTDTTKDKKGYDRIVTAENPKAGTSVAKGTHVALTWHSVKQK